MHLFRFVLAFLLLTQIGNADDLKPAITVEIPMRDGTLLPTDIYLPNKEARHLPCILLRLPAGRAAKPWVDYAALSQLGYAVAFQDTRSAIDQEGKTLPYLSDGWWKNRDGYDTVEWLAKSEFTNGKVGTLGFSAAGVTQMLLAPSMPPSLVCQYIGVAPGSLYHHAIYPGGQILKNQVEGWVGLYTRDTGVLNQICGQPYYNDFWQYLDAIKTAHQVNVPGLIYGGWYDTFLQGTIDAFVARQEMGGEGARGKQKLIIGPWTHYYPQSTKLGDFEVPEAGYAPPFDMSPQKWFEHYLKGVENGINEIPPVTYYVMGPFDGSPSTGNRWKFAQKWPVPADFTSFYFTKDHRLIKEEVPQAAGILSYLYDPKAPIPTLGGCNLFLEAGPKDQTTIESRADVLVFTSEELTEDTEVTGQVLAKVFFATDCDDTDIVVRLTDVYPDGRSILVSDGAHRTGISGLVQGNREPKEVEVDLWSTSLVFAKGHKIRVSVSSSNYPKFEKNMNVGVVGANSGSCNVAHNSFYVGPLYPSRIILPIVKERLGE